MDEVNYFTQLKNSKSSVEALYYEWLGEALTSQYKTEFCRILDILYRRFKTESIAGFTNLTKRFLLGCNQDEQTKEN